VARYTGQLLSALCWLHCRNQAHLDIKPENVLIDQETDQVKVIDLGEAVRTPVDEVVPPPADLEFAAPELVLGRPTGPYTDMWAVGVFIYVLLRYLKLLRYISIFSILFSLFFDDIAMSLYVTISNFFKCSVDCRLFWTIPWRKLPPTYSNVISVFLTSTLKRYQMT